MCNKIATSAHHGLETWRTRRMKCDALKGFRNYASLCHRKTTRDAKRHGSAVDTYQEVSTHWCPVTRKSAVRHDAISAQYKILGYHDLIGATSINQFTEPHNLRVQTLPNLIQLVTSWDPGSVPNQSRGTCLMENTQPNRWESGFLCKQKVMVW